MIFRPTKLMLSQVERRKSEDLELEAGGFGWG